jgi:hypothetical protein
MFVSTNLDFRTIFDVQFSSTSFFIPLPDHLNSVICTHFNVYFNLNYFIDMNLELRMLSSCITNISRYSHIQYSSFLYSL